MSPRAGVTLENTVNGDGDADVSDERTEDREPDPARSYERAKPEKEAGMGRMDDAAGKATPAPRPDEVERAVHNAHAPRQINADDDAVDPHAAGAAGRVDGLRPPGFAEPDHAMFDDEPLGEDLMPTDIHDPRTKRHPRKEGKGGTP